MAKIRLLRVTVSKNKQQRHRIEEIFISCLVSRFKIKD